jgi:coenzyme F420-reducing hydrogenase gamma subunit
MVSKGVPCLGPVTQAGCGAICPAFNRGCYGCFGPMENPNTSSLSKWWNEKLGVEREDLVRAYRGFNAYSESFRTESEVHES